jgi:hypothetical protein
MICLLVLACSLQGPGALAVQVDAATQRGVEFLLQRQYDDGSWHMANLEKYTGGTTTLGAFALLKAGLPKQHQAIRLSVEYLRSNPPIYIYDAALRVLLLLALDPIEYRARIQRSADLLMEFPLNYYSYGIDLDRGATGDLSNQQFALVGLEALDRHGFEVPKKFWLDSAKFLQRNQFNNGTWGYFPKQKPSPTMLLAGLASLASCQRALERKKATSSQLAKLNEHIEQALQLAASEWLLDQKDDRAPLNRWFLCGCYGLERAMALTRTSRLGEHDWYPEVARRLLDMQKKNGSWSSRKGENEMNTAFALLTLARATANVGTTGGTGRRNWDYRWQTSSTDSLMRITAAGAPNCQAFLSAMDDEAMDLMIFPNERRPRIVEFQWWLEQELVGQYSYSETEAIEIAQGMATPRFATKFSLPQNGSYQLQARFQYMQPNWRGETEVSFDWLESEPLAIEVRGIWGSQEKAQLGFRDQHAQSGRPEDQKLKIEASSSIGGAEGMRRALDRCQATSWRWKAGDHLRRWKVEFDQPFRATALRLLPALPPDQSLDTYQNPTRVRIRINGATRKSVLINREQLRTGVILTFPKRLKVRKFELEVEQVESTQKANIGGFREIEFLLE